MTRLKSRIQHVGIALLGLGTAFCLATSFPASAQTDLHPIFEANAGDIVNVSWSSDGQSLVFQQLSLTFGNQHDVQSWIQYSLATNKITYSHQWPLQPALTSFQQRNFELATTIDNLASYAYISPNRRYVVYGAIPPPDWLVRPYTWAGSLPIGIADLQTGEYIITEGLWGVSW